MPKLSKELLSALPKRTRKHLLPVLLTIRVAGFLLAVLALWVFATLAYEILAQESFTFDQQILLALRQLHQTRVDVFMLGFTYIGEPVVLMALCAGLSIWLLKMGERSALRSVRLSAHAEVSASLSQVNVKPKSY